MSMFVAGVLSFLGGVVVGIIGMFLSDSRYLKNIQNIYEGREKQFEKKIDKQKETIDDLIKVNNDYQIEIQKLRNERKVKKV